MHFKFSHVKGKDENGFPALGKTRLSQAPNPLLPRVRWRIYVQKHMGTFLEQADLSGGRL